MSKEIQSSTSGISEKIVLLTNPDSLLINLLIGLKRFRNVVRWKEFFLNNLEEKENNEDFKQEELECIANCKGDDDFSNSLGTFLKPNILIKLQQVQWKLRFFLKEVETILVEKFINIMIQKSK